MVCPPAWRRRCIGGLCGRCIVCAGIWQINGNAAAKSCKGLLCFGCIICIDGRKTTVNACVRLVRRRAKIKALHPEQMQGKRKARPFLTGWNASYFDALNSAEKNQKKNKIQENIMRAPP